MPCSVDAFFTANLYTECWLEHCKGGTIYKGLRCIVDAAQQHRLQQLLHKAPPAPAAPAQPSVNPPKAALLSGGAPGDSQPVASQQTAGCQSSPYPAAAGGALDGDDMDPTLLPFLATAPSAVSMPHVASKGSQMPTKGQPQPAAVGLRPEQAAQVRSRPVLGMDAQENLIWPVHGMCVPLKHP